MKKLLFTPELLGAPEQQSRTMNLMEFMNSNEPNVVLVEIDPLGNWGIDLLKALQNTKAKVMFVTRNEDQAKGTLKTSVLETIKPIDINEILAAINRMVLRQENTEPVIPKRKVGLPCANGIRYFEMKEIELVCANGSYADVHTTLGERVIIAKNLKFVQSMLDNKDFMRVHRSSTINLRHVKKFSRSEGGLVSLTGGYEVPVSLDKREELLQRLSGI